jgi:hypothetical protein
MAVEPIRLLDEVAAVAIAEAGLRGCGGSGHGDDGDRQQTYRNEVLHDLLSPKRRLLFFSPELRATRFPRRSSVERRVHARSVALTEEMREKQISMNGR